MQSLFTRIARQWFPLAVGLSAMACIVFAVVQQDIRMGTNDPQIQMAEDLANNLNRGEKPAVSGNIDIAKSLAPFALIYDKNGNLISTNATINGMKPAFPRTALTGHKDTDIPGENRVTWQPQENVRLATVVVAYTKGYVVVGRNMRESEIRIAQQFTNISIGWLISLVVTLLAVIGMETVMKKDNKISK